MRRLQYPLRLPVKGSGFPIPSYPFRSISLINALILFNVFCPRFANTDNHPRHHHPIFLSFIYLDKFVFCAKPLFQPIDGVKKSLLVGGIVEIICSCCDFKWNTSGSSRVELSGESLISSPQVSTLHIVHSADQDSGKPLHRGHCRTHIRKSAATLLQCAVPVPG